MNYQFYLFHNCIPIIIISCQIMIISCYDHHHTNINVNMILRNSKVMSSQHQNDHNNYKNKINIKSNYNKRGLLRNTSLRASSDGNYNGMNGKKPKHQGNNKNKNNYDNDEWLEDNDESTMYTRLNEDNNLPFINDNIYNTLDQTLGEMITVSAIDTLSYYMIEFHDDDTQRWMVSFKNYKTKGFKSNNNNNNNNNSNKNDNNTDDNTKLSWQSYIEDMIKLDTQYFKVYVDPPRVASRLKDVKMKDKNLKVMYIDEIQPRKIAHRLISVREDVSNEVLTDLG